MTDDTSRQPVSAPPARPRGRRRGSPQTRDEVLAAARRTFADHGYRQATIRLIATEAGVDPSLVIQFFGTKEELFREVLRLILDPQDAGLARFRDGAGGIGHRLTEFYLGLWERPETRQTLAATMISASVKEEAGRAMRDFVGRRLLPILAAEIGTDLLSLRVSLATSHLFGLMLNRHLLRAEPLASIALPALVELVAPAVDHYLTGELRGVLDADLPNPLRELLPSRTMP